jgi:hypothetical protein
MWKAARLPERNSMPQPTTAPQCLKLHPEIFGQAFPESRASRPDWLPEDVFACITNTQDEYSILCPQGFIPPSVSQVRGLRVLFLHPGGPMISEVMQNIDEDLIKENIPAIATCNYGVDAGFVVVSDEDLPRVSSLLAESGHTVEEPETP